MKNISTGFGLCVLGLGMAAWPVLDRLAPNANAGAVNSAASAVSTAAAGQAAPTIVWYGTDSNTAIYRAWSDGRIESMVASWSYDTSYQCWRLRTDGSPLDNCPQGWLTVSDPAQGLTYRSDINFDSKVDGADLGQLLADWGDAPRQDIPPSDCPLALINP